MNKPIQQELFKVSQAIPPVTESWFLVMPDRGGRRRYIAFASRAGLDYHIATRRRNLMSAPLYALHVLPRG